MRNQMKLLKNNFKAGALLFAGTGVGLGLLFSAVTQRPVFEMPASAEDQPNRSLEVTKTPSAPSTNNGVLPDQSHSMVDVGYHFANLWFAADKENWPLADYYLSETRSHLRWAVRIHPVRKTKAGAEIDLKGILDAVDNSFLTEMGTAITNKDSAKFK